MQWLQSSSPAPFPAFLPSPFPPLPRWSPVHSFAFWLALASAAFICWSWGWQCSPCKSSYGQDLPFIKASAHVSPLRCLRVPPPPTVTVVSSLQSFRLWNALVYILPNTWRLPERGSVQGCFPPAQRRALSGIRSVADGEWGLTEPGPPWGGNLYSFCSADGNRFQHPAGDHDPYGILCLQTHSASLTAEQAVPECGNRISGVAHGSVEKLESELSCLEMTSGLDNW